MRCTPNAVVRPSQQRIGSAPTCSVSEVIVKSNLEEIDMYRNGNTFDIIKTIKYADVHSDEFVRVEGLDCLLGSTEYDTLRNVWRFVRYNLRYVADRRGWEKVHSPGALFTRGRGDCKSYSIAIVAILRAMGFTGLRYRFVSFVTPTNYTHVYVVVKSGGRDVVLDAVYEHFDQEPRGIRNRLDEKARRSVAVSGIAGSGVQGDISTTINLLALGFGGYVLYRLFTDR